jgi:hypothetical protein
MAEPHAQDDRRRVPATFVNGTRVTIAFPFSQIKIEEPPQELRVLAHLVSDLAEAVAALAGNEETAALRRRAGELAAALDGIRSSPPPRDRNRRLLRLRSSIDRSADRARSRET